MHKQCDASGRPYATPRLRHALYTHPDAHRVYAVSHALAPGRDTETTCHCGASYAGWDHCRACGCEQYESLSCPLSRVTVPLTDPVSWGESQAVWAMLDDMRREGYPFAVHGQPVAFFAVRSQPDPGWPAHASTYNYH